MDNTCLLPGLHNGDFRGKKIAKENMNWTSKLLKQSLSRGLTWGGCFIQMQICKTFNYA